MMTEHQPLGFSERRVVLEGSEARLMSYQVGDRWAARVDNIDPGSTVGRGRGATREEAEKNAMTSAAVKFGMTAGRNTLRNSMNALRAPLKNEDDG